MELLGAAVGVAFFGGLGSVIRYFASMWPGVLPVGTLIVNTVGSFIAGVAIATGVYEFALIVGLAGGLSTFSTFAGQTYDLLAARRKLLAALNVALNLVFPAAALSTALILL